LGLRTRELHHLAPFLGFVGDELAEIGGRATENNAAEVGELSLQLGIGEGGLDFAGKLFRKFYGRVPLRAHTPPIAYFVARYELAYGRSIGQPFPTGQVVTANGRSLPAVMCSIDDDIGSKITCTCPASRSVNAGALPRYGT